MRLIVDGHNVIGTGRLPGISLDSEDDEARLVSLLRRYRSRIKGQITVVFDRGIVGGESRTLSSKGVSVRFAPVSSSADDVIVQLVRRENPAGVTVVTSDGELASRVRRLGARVISSAEFVSELRRPLPSPEENFRERPHLSKEEIEAWEAIFSSSRRSIKDE
jgi:predicted RNA-binding protein with PIN domain